MSAIAHSSADGCLASQKSSSTATSTCPLLSSAAADTDSLVSSSASQLESETERLHVSLQSLLPLLVEASASFAATRTKEAVTLRPIILLIQAHAKTLDENFEELRRRLQVLSKKKMSPVGSLLPSHEVRHIHGHTQMRFESKEKEKKQEETTSTNNWNGDASAAEAGEKLLRKQAKKLASARKNAADLLTQCTKLRLETNDLEKMNQALTSKLEVAKKAQVEASNHATSLKSELAVLQKKMGAMGKENQSLLAKLKDIGSSQRTLDIQASVSVLKSKLEAVEKEKQSLQSKIEKTGSSQRKLAEAQKHTAELEAKQTTLESKLEAVEKEKQSLQSKIEKLQLSFQSGVLADSFGRSHPRQAACVGPRGTLVDAASDHVPARPASTATASRAPAKPEHRSKTTALTRALSAEAQAQTRGEGPQGRGVARRVSQGQAVEMPKETKTGKGSTAASVEDSRRQADGMGKGEVGSGRRGAGLAWSSMTTLLPRGSANSDPPLARQAAPLSFHPPCSATNASFPPLDPGVGGIEGQGARLGCEKGPGGEAGKKEGPAGGASGAGRPDLFPLPRPQSERQGREGGELRFGLRRSGSSGRQKDGSGPPLEYPEMAPWELYRLVQELTESVREKEEHLELQRDFAKRVGKKLHKLEIKVRKVMDLPLDWDTRGE